MKNIELKKYNEESLPKLFEFWKKIGTSIPYFFSVSDRRWQSCLLQDELNGEPTFKDLETFIAIEKDQILGFVQYGQPNFGWSTNGEKLYSPQIGVIRHFYFEKTRCLKYLPGGDYWAIDIFKTTAENKEEINDLAPILCEYITSCYKQKAKQRNKILSELRKNFVKNGHKMHFANKLSTKYGEITISVK